MLLSNALENLSLKPFNLSLKEKYNFIYLYIYVIYFKDSAYYDLIKMLH